LAVIAAEWKDLSASGIRIALSPSAAFFYVLTGAYSLLVFAGISWLLAVIPGRAPASSTQIKAAQIYWNFLAGLWVFLLALVYFLR
jgi:heme/copper-type cytochrome/quinol oxidase subunit 3